MIQKLKNLLRAELAEALIKRKNNQINFIKRNNFGNLNKNKKFYIIKKKFNSTGLFSNLAFVLDHIKYSEKKNLIPIVDMENFPTVYNEKNKISGSFNSWNYYFKPINNYSLNEIYRSTNVYFSTDIRKTIKEVNQDASKQKILQKYIKFKPNIIKEFKKNKKKIFKKKLKIMGVHVRGTLQRIVRNHSYPPDPKDIVIECKKIFKKHKCDKIFLVTEDLLYFENFKKYFKNNLVYLKTPRSYPTIFGSHNIHFKDYCRSLHRYKLGKETIIDALLLSKTDVFLFTDSNVWRFATVLSKKNQFKYQLKTHRNSKNIFFARWLWYLKYIFPLLFGKINYKIKKYKNDN